MRRLSRLKVLGASCLWLALSLMLVLALASIILFLAIRNPSTLAQGFTVIAQRISGSSSQIQNPRPVATRGVTRVARAQNNSPTLAPTRTRTQQPTSTSKPSSTNTAPPTNTLPPTETKPKPTATAKPSATATRDIGLKPIQPAVKLAGFVYERQRYNNCGPTTLHMYLSYFGRSDTQVQIASVVKPDPMDKNVNPWQLVSYAKSQGLNSTYRVNGTLDRLKLFLSNGLPVVAEMGFVPQTTKEGWMGHYRMLTGYDDKKFIMQDSYLGADYTLTFKDFENEWRAFNRTYWVVYNDMEAPIVKAIIGKDMNDTHMYTAAAARAQSEFDANPRDGFAAFNLGSSLVGLKKYTEASEAFDRAFALNLPWRMMWYQFGPYEAFYQTGRYEDVIGLANATLKVADNLEESHYYKGLALEKLGRVTEAKAEFQKALQYNKYFQDAQRELSMVSK